jgi:hypothetical protein
MSYSVTAHSGMAIVDLKNIQGQKVNLNILLRYFLLFVLLS